MTFPSLSLLSLTLFATDYQSREYSLLVRALVGSLDARPFETEESILRTIYPDLHVQLASAEEPLRAPVGKDRPFLSLGAYSLLVTRQLQSIYTKQHSHNHPNSLSSQIPDRL